MKANFLQTGLLRLCLFKEVSGFRFQVSSFRFQSRKLSGSSFKFQSRKLSGSGFNLFISLRNIQFVLNKKGTTGAQNQKNTCHNQ